MNIDIVWVSEDRLASIPYRFQDIKLVAEFPIFCNHVPNENRDQREARWKATYKSISKAQREYIKMAVLHAFQKCLSKPVDTLSLADLDRRLKSACDELSVVSPHIQTRFTTYQKEKCIETTFQFMIGSNNHVIHVCNLSPSEYEQLR